MKENRNSAHPQDCISTLVGKQRLAVIPRRLSDEEFRRSLFVGKFYLNQQEWALINLLLQGYSRTEMSLEMNVTNGAIDSWMSTLYYKLRVKNERQACALAAKWGVGHDEDNDYT